ncbi:hypothetical protein FI667_g17260, partial [Globisporangium splendens]
MPNGNVLALPRSARSCRLWHPLPSDSLAQHDDSDAARCGQREQRRRDHRQHSSPIVIVCASETVYVTLEEVALFALLRRVIMHETEHVRRLAATAPRAHVYTCITAAFVAQKRSNSRKKSLCSMSPRAQVERQMDGNSASDDEQGARDGRLTGDERFVPVRSRARGRNGRARATAGLATHMRANHVR